MKLLLPGYILLYFILASLSAQSQSDNNINAELLRDSDQTKRSPVHNKLYLGQNYPNPFSVNESTAIPYKAIDSYEAYLVFYTEEGIKISVQRLHSDNGNVVIKGSELSAGTYAYALVVNGRRIAKKKLVVTP